MQVLMTVRPLLLKYRGSFSSSPLCPYAAFNATVLNGRDMSRLISGICILIKLFQRAFLVIYNSSSVRSMAQNMPSRAYLDRAQPPTTSEQRTFRMLGVLLHLSTRTVYLAGSAFQVTQTYNVSHSKLRSCDATVIDNFDEHR